MLSSVAPDCVGDSVVARGVWSNFFLSFQMRFLKAVLMLIELGGVGLLSLGASVLDLLKLSGRCCFVVGACSVDTAAVAPSSCEVLLVLPVDSW